MKIDWCKCILQSKCRLELLNLKNEFFDNFIGVYVIWYENDKKRIVSIGHGIIRDKLTEMKADKEVLACSPDLFVTWAAVPELSLEGVDAYLCKELNPLLQKNIKSSDLISVNLP